MADIGRPSALGEEAELRVPIQVDYELVKQERIPFDPEFSRQTRTPWVKVRTDQIRAARALWGVPIFRTVRRMHKDELNKGGVQIQIGSGVPKTFGRSTFLGKLLLNWGAQVLFNRWMFGFAIVTAIPSREELRFVRERLIPYDHKHHNVDEEEDDDEGGGGGGGAKKKRKLRMTRADGGTDKNDNGGGGGDDQDPFDMDLEPVIVPPENVDVYYRESIYGEANWDVRLPGSHLDEDNNIQGKHLTGSYVICDEAPIATTGAINSVVMSLRDDYMAIKDLFTYMLRAEGYRSQWMFMTEQATTNKSNDTTPRGVITNSDSGLVPMTAAKENAEGFSNGQNISIPPGQMGALQASMDPDDWVRYLHKLQEQRMAMQLPGPLMYVGSDRKLVNPSRPEGPADFHKKVLAFKATVLETFNIPTSMVLAESTNGKVAHNEHAVGLWQKHMATIKQEVLDPMTVMFRLVARNAVIRRMTKAAAKQWFDGKRTLDKAEVMRESNVQLTLPGIPEPAVVEMLYDRGWLKYEAAIGYEAAYYQIPKEHFEKKPQISRMDLLTGGKNKMQQNDQNAKSEMQDKQNKADLRQSQFAAGAQKSLAQEKGKQDRLKLKEAAKNASSDTTGRGGAKSASASKKRKRT